MIVVIDRIVEVLTFGDGIGIPSNRLGTKRPANANEIPAVTISLYADEHKREGIGRFVRAGDSLAESSSVVQVSGDGDRFSSDLRRLKLSPLPIKKNPSSTQRAFGSDDVRVRNVSVEPATEYLFSEKPTAANEFKIDARLAIVQFGAPQVEGDLLEIVQWTVAWRDKIQAERFSGTATLDVRAATFEATEQVSRNLQARINGGRSLLREKGFSRFHPRELGPVESSLENQIVGSPFSVWHQKLSYRFWFEAIEGGQLSQGAPIRQIDVDITESSVESISIR